jgi:hypothetical protein
VEGACGTAVVSLKASVKVGSEGGGRIEGLNGCVKGGRTLGGWGAPREPVGRKSNILCGERRVSRQ